MCRKLILEICDTQLCFRNGLGVRETLFGVSVLVQICLAVTQEIYVCFIDFEKASYKVERDKLVETFKAKYIANRDIGIVLNLRRSEC